MKKLLVLLLVSVTLTGTHSQDVVPISQLPAVGAGGLSASDVFPVVHAGGTKKATISQLQSAINNRVCLGDTFCYGVANHILYLDANKKLMVDESFKRFGTDSALIATNRKRGHV